MSTKAMTDTLAMATQESRRVLATYWKSPMTSMTTAVRCECYRDGTRYVAILRPEGWEIDGRIVPESECGEYRTILARGPRGDVIVFGSHGPCWVSDSRAMIAM